MHSTAWNFEEHLDGVAALHDLGVPQASRRLVRWCVPDRSALVLGSAQPHTDVRSDVAASLKVDVVRRRSGGGAVLVEPGDIFWVDVVIPPHDLLWHDDVGKAFHWLGHVWVDALRRLGVSDLQVHEGALVTNEWSRKVCFAGLGPGEVTRAGRKLVGISQRRTRDGVLFQCALLLHVRSERMDSLIVPIPDASCSVDQLLRSSTWGMGGVDDDRLRLAFAAALS